MKNLMLLTVTLALAAGAFFLPWGEVFVTGVPMHTFKGSDALRDSWQGWNVGSGIPADGVPEDLPGRLWSQVALGALCVAAAGALLGALFGGSMTSLRRIAALAAAGSLLLVRQDWRDTLDLDRAFRDAGLGDIPGELGGAMQGLLVVEFTPWFWAALGLAVLAALLPGGHRGGASVC